MSGSTTNSFSPDHRFSRAEVAEAVDLVAAEPRVKRLLLNVTMAHRTLAIRQSTVTMLVGALTMLSLYVTEISTPSLDRHLLTVWALATVVNIATRLALYRWLFASRTPAEVARSTGMRLIPLAIAVLSAF